MYPIILGVAQCDSTPSPYHEFNPKTQKHPATSPKPSFTTRHAKTPPFHTVTADAWANALKHTSLVLVNLQNPRPRPRGTHDMIENLSAGLQRYWTGRGTRRTVRRATRVRSIWFKD